MIEKHCADFGSFYKSLYKIKVVLYSCTHIFDLFTWSKSWYLVLLKDDLCNSSPTVFGKNQNQLIIVFLIFSFLL